MIFVDRKKIPLPEVFSSNELKIADERLRAFYNRHKDLRSQERFSKLFNVELQNEFLTELEKVFNGKCAYCESIIESKDKAICNNFRPIGGARGLNNEFSNDHYWWLTYEWNNLYYCCSTCNNYKSTWFPVEGKRVGAETSYRNTIIAENNLLLDPCNDRPEQHLIFSKNGEVDFITAKGETTIEILKLNRVDLVEARKLSTQFIDAQERSIVSTFLTEGRASAGSDVLYEWGNIFSDNSTKAYQGFNQQILRKHINESPGLLDFLLEYDSRLFSLDKLSIYEPGKYKLTQESGASNKFSESDQNKTVGDQLNLEAVKHNYVERLELKNFKCFSQLIIDFNRNDLVTINNKTGINSAFEPWMLFLGENSVGKSSILKALAIGLSGNNYIKTLEIRGKDILKHYEDEGHIKIHFVGEPNPISVHFNKNTISSTVDQPLVNLVAYNSIRLLPKKNKLIPERNKINGAKIKNLFDYTVSLIDADDWLLKRPQQIFDRAALTLKDLMLLDGEDRIEIFNNRIRIKRLNGYFYIDELSDGYQSIYALAVDIMATLARENATFDLVEGMVLIDEIGTHLHPRWRMQVVERLRNAFPKIRFVVTTHEPLCLRGLKAGETIVLVKNVDREVIALTDLPDPSELRVDQILTSDFFGLKSTIDPQTEKLFDEYYSILALDEDNRDDDQKNRLIFLNEIIPKMKHLGDNLREELVYYVIDELLANKTKKDGLKIAGDLKIEAVKRVKSLWDSISRDDSL